MALYRRNMTSVQLEGRERRCFLFTIKEANPHISLSFFS